MTRLDSIKTRTEKAQQTVQRWEAKRLIHEDIPYLIKEVLRLREALELIELGKLDCDPVLIAREALGEE